MRTSYLTGLVYTYFIGRVASFDPGVTASLDINVFDQAKDVYFDLIMNVLENVKLPDFPFQKESVNGHMNDNTFGVLEIPSNVQITNRPDVNGIELSIDDLYATFFCKDFTFNYAFVHAAGNVTVDFQHFTVKAIASFDTQTLQNGKVVPAFKIEVIDVDLPKEFVSIKIQGNVFAQIADVFKPIFESMVRNEIVIDLKKILANKVPPLLNKIISDQNGFT